jgi:hypothetical protein
MTIGRRTDIFFNSNEKLVSRSKERWLSEFLEA